jgi:zinc protease
VAGVSASIDDREISSQFVITATARPGEGLARIEKAITEQLERFLAKGPTPQEVERARARKIAGFVRGRQFKRI